MGSHSGSVKIGIAAIAVSISYCAAVCSASSAITVLGVPTGGHDRQLRAAGPLDVVHQGKSLAHCCAPQTRRPWLRADQSPWHCRRSATSLFSARPRSSAYALRNHGRAHGLWNCNGPWFSAKIPSLSRDRNPCHRMGMDHTAHIRAPAIAPALWDA